MNDHRRVGLPQKEDITGTRHATVFAESLSPQGCDDVKHRCIHSSPLQNRKFLFSRKCGQRKRHHPQALYYGAPSRQILFLLLVQVYFQDINIYIFHHHTATLEKNYEQNLDKYQARITAARGGFLFARADSPLVTSVKFETVDASFQQCHNALVEAGGDKVDANKYVKFIELYSNNQITASTYDQLPLQLIRDYTTTSCAICGNNQTLFHGYKSRCCQGSVVYIPTAISTTYEESYMIDVCSTITQTIHKILGPTSNWGLGGQGWVATTISPINMMTTPASGAVVTVQPTPAPTMSSAPGKNVLL